jgi:hypothetical protein
VDLVVGGFRESGSSVDRLRESSPHVDGFRVSCSSVDSVADRRIKSVIEDHKHDTSFENCNITNHAITPIYEDDGFLTIDDSKYIILN